MSSPYKPPTGPLDPPARRATTTAGKLGRTVVLAVTAVLAFGLGCAGTLLALIYAFAPSGPCESPCDAPAYVAIGLSVFVGPVLGIIAAIGSVLAVRRAWPVRASAAA